MNSSCFDFTASASDVALTSIRRRLSVARSCANADLLFSSLHWTDLEAKFDARPLVEELPDLADRFRGALGRALERLGPEAETAWALLYGRQIPTESGIITRPYIIRANRIRNEILFRVRLFGFADCWADQVLKAMEKTGEHGIALRMHGKVRVALSLVSTSMQTFFWSPAEEYHRRMRVTMITPLILRHRQSLHGSLEGFYQSCTRRLVGIANWCDVLPAPEALRELADSPWWISDPDLHPVSWVRRSSNHPDGRNHAGLIGHFVVEGLNGISQNLLKSADLFGAGGGTTSGNGEIRVIR